MISGLFRLKDLHRNLEDSNPLEFSQTKPIVSNEQTPKKFLWIAVIHPNPIGISTSPPTSFYTHFV
jgi:hypothetical protein